MASERKRRNAASVAEILPRALSQKGFSRLLEAGRVMAVWEKVVGPALAGHTKPMSFREGVLIVAVDSSAWLFQVERFHKRMIQDKLNRVLGKKLIQKIVFRAGEVD